MPPFLSSYHKHLTHSSESTTYSILPCNHGKNSVVSSSKPLTHLKCSPSLAFHTITMMLSFIQSTTGQLERTVTMTAPLGTNREDCRYTVCGLGQARSRPFLLALDPGSQGWATLSWPWPKVSLTLGQLGQARVKPGLTLTPQFYQHMTVYL